MSDHLTPGWYTFGRDDGKGEVYMVRLRVRAGTGDLVACGKDQQARLAADLALTTPRGFWWRRLNDNPQVLPISTKPDGTYQWDISMPPPVVEPGDL